MSAITNTKPEGIIIVVEGGLVSAVVSHNRDHVGTKFTVIDYDCEGADACEIYEVEHADGSFADAATWHGIVDQASIKSITWSEEDGRLPGRRYDRRQLPVWPVRRP